jgi:hypothetical protein
MDPLVLLEIRAILVHRGQRVLEALKDKRD